jgi:hypothetical protein
MKIKRIRRKIAQKENTSVKQQKSKERAKKTLTRMEGGEEES